MNDIHLGRKIGTAMEPILIAVAARGTAEILNSLHPQPLEVREATIRMWRIADENQRAAEAALKEELL